MDTRTTVLRGSFEVERTKVTRGDPFGYFIVVDGKPTRLNAIGFIRYKEKYYIILTDMPEFGISSEEYGIAEIEGIKEQQPVLKDVEDEEVYKELCELWETSTEEIDEEG